MKVLVVDDDATLRKTLEIGLRAEGHEVLLAADGRSALQAVTEDQPDLVVLDLGLPDLSGVEVLRQLRTWSQLPVVVLSARDGSHDKVEALDVGADDYVTKPFGTDELSARIRAAGTPGGLGRPGRRGRFAHHRRAGTPGDPRRDRRTTDARRSGDCSRYWCATPDGWSASATCSTRCGGRRTRRGTNYLRVYVAKLRRSSRTIPRAAPPRHRARHGLPLRGLTLSASGRAGTGPARVRPRTRRRARGRRATARRPRGVRPARGGRRRPRRWRRSSRPARGR